MRSGKQKLAAQDADIRGYLERAVCPLCGGEGGDIEIEAGDTWNPKGPARGLKFKVRRCKGRGACFTSPRFREDSKHIPFLGRDPLAERGRRPAAVTPKEMKPFRYRVERLQLLHPTPGVLLDLAMGDGAFLHLMRTRRWTVAGIEKDRELVNFVKTKRALEHVSACDIEYDALPAGPFNVVTLWDLLPRLYRPQALLLKIRPLLAPGGMIAISVPNFRSAGAGLFGKHWSGLGIPRHLLHFDPASLRQLLESSGYQIVELTFETPAAMVRDSVRSAVPSGMLRAPASALAALALGPFAAGKRGDTMVLIARC